MPALSDVAAFAYEVHELATRDTGHTTIKDKLSPNATQVRTLIVIGVYTVVIGILWWASIIFSLSLSVSFSLSALTLGIYHSYRGFVSLAIRLLLLFESSEL